MKALHENAALFISAEDKNWNGGQNNRKRRYDQWKER